MSHEADARLSWSVRHGANAAYAQRVFDDTLAACQQLVSDRLPATAGYEVRRVQLAGSLQGWSLRVSRGMFRASLSLQRFHNRAHDDGSPMELRIVAHAHHAPAQPPSPRRRTGLRLTSGAAASFGVGVLALAVSGGLTAWATAVLLIPAMFATRLCMALWIADDIRQRALPPASSLPATTLTAAHARDLRRWATLQVELRRLHETTAERFVLRPFRGLGGNTSARLALPPGLEGPLHSTG